MWVRTQESSAITGGSKHRRESELPPVSLWAVIEASHTVLGTVIPAGMQCIGPRVRQAESIE